MNIGTVKAVLPRDSDLNFVIKKAGVSIQQKAFIEGLRSPKARIEA